METESTNPTAFLRLVWKEYRTQRAFWLAMVGLTLLVQVVFASLSPADRGTGSVVAPLFAFALMFTALYAGGCGATLFATERETGTYEFQRTVPVSWLRLFAAKMTWAGLSTTSILAMLVFLAACVSRWQLPEAALDRQMWGLLGFGAAELLLWGVFFSLVVDQPLVAAILAVATVSSYVHVLAHGPMLWQDMSGYLAALPWRMAVAAVAGVADLWLARRWFHGKGKVLALSAARRGPETPSEAAALPPEPERPSQWVFFGHLLWQQWRQSRRMMLVLAILAVPWTWIGVQVSLVPPFVYNGRPELVIVLASLFVGLMGSCVFLGDQRRERFRFLAEHAVRPGYVWLSRQLVWIAAAALVVTMVFPVFARLALEQVARDTSVARVLFDDLNVRSQFMGPYVPPHGIDLQRVVLFSGYVWNLLLSVAVAYAAGQFCSMLLRSGILAAVFGLMLAGGLCFWTFLMRWLYMNPLWMVAPIPVVLLLATRLRTADWILERNSVRTWLPVAAVVVVPAVGILVAVPLVRVHSIPEPIVLRSVPPFMQVFPPDMDLRTERTPEERTTAEMYRRAMDLVRPMKSFSVPKDETKLAEAKAPNGPQPESPPVVTPQMVAWVKGNEEALALTLAATRRPLGDVTHPPKPEYLPRQNMSYWDLWHLLVTSAQVAQSQGNLGDAMERYLAALRLTRYEAFNMRGSDFGWDIGWEESHIYNHLTYWAALPSETPQRLRAMLREIDALVKSFPPLDLTVKQQRALVLDLLAGDPQAIAAVGLPDDVVYKIALYSRWFPWEITRAHRILEQEAYRDWQFCGELENSAAIGEKIHVGSLEDYQSAPNLYSRRGEPLGLGEYYPQERLSSDFAQRFRELVAGRRVIQLTLALEAWRLEHGRLPDSLDALVGPDLPRLPNDPYSGQPFEYIPAGFAFPIVGSSHGGWKIYSSGTPMLASVPLSLVLGTPGAVTRVDEEWCAPYWPDWPASKTSWFACRGIYPLPRPRKSSTAGTRGIPKEPSDAPEGRLTIAQRFIAGDADPRRTARPVGTVETGGTAAGNEIQASLRDAHP